MKTLAKSFRNLKSKIQGGFRKLRKNGSPQKSEGNVSVRTQIVEVGLYPADGIYSGYLDSFIQVSRITLTKITAVLMLAFFTLLPGQPKAQSSDLGTTGFFIGPSLSSVSFSGMGNYSQESTIKGTSLLGIQGGVSEKLDIGRFYIKPMVLTGYQSGMANYTTNEGVTTSYKVDYGNVQVPFNIGAKITGPFSLEAGSLFNWIYSSQYYLDNYLSINPAGYGYRIAANLDFGKANLSLAYQGFTNSTMNTYSATFKSPTMVSLNVGYNFKN